GDHPVGGIAAIHVPGNGFRAGPGRSARVRGRVRPGAAASRHAGVPGYLQAGDRDVPADDSAASAHAKTQERLNSIRVGSRLFAAELIMELYGIAKPAPSARAHVPGDAPSREGARPGPGV